MRGSEDVSGGTPFTAAVEECCHRGGVSMPSDEIAEDRVKPEGKWEFDGEVAQVFDNMLQRSIPQYDIMRKAVFDVAKRYIDNQRKRIIPYIVDLGCSRGEAIRPFHDHYGTNARYVGCEVSEPMLEAARENFKYQLGSGVMNLQNLDLRKEYPHYMATCTLSILTLQFIPIEYRQHIIQEIYDHTVPGGVLIFVEKVLGNTAGIDRTLVDTYYQLKQANGYSTEDIERKRLSLEGVLVPVTAKWNEELLKGAGFKEVDCFWRWMNFAGWVAVKEDHFSNCEIYGCPHQA